MVKVNVRRIIGACIPIITIIIIFITMFSNSWYTADYNEEIKMEDVDFGDGVEVDEVLITMEGEGKQGLKEMEAKGEAVFSYKDPTLPGGEIYEEQHISETHDLKGDEEDIGNLMLIFLIVTLVLIFGFMVVGILAGLGIIHGYIPMIIGFLAIVTLLLPIIYYPIVEPEADKKESIRSFEEENEDAPEEIKEEFYKLIDDVTDDST